MYECNGNGNGVTVTKQVDVQWPHSYQLLVVEFEKAFGAPDSQGDL